MPNAPEVSEIVAATSARVAAIRASVRQWEDSLQNIRTPQQVYQEKRQALRDAFNQELQLLMSGEAGDDGASRENRTESLIQYGGQLRELEQQYAAAIRADEKAYQQRVEKQTARLVAALRDLGDDSLTASDQEEPAQPVDKQAVVAAPSDPPPETRTDSHVPHHEDHHMEEVPEVRRTSDDNPQTDPDPQPVRPSRSDSMVAHVDQPDPQPVNHTQPDSRAANVSQPDRQPASHPVTHPRTVTKPKSQSLSDSKPSSQPPPSSQPVKQPQYGSKQAIQRLSDPKSTSQPVSHPRLDPNPTDRVHSDPKTRNPSRPDPKRTSQSRQGSKPANDPLSDLKSTSQRQLGTKSASQPCPNPQPVNRPVIQPQPDPKPTSQPTHPSQRKRVISPATAPGGRAKRPRTTNLLAPLGNQATIEYDDVYQGGKAEIKHQIVRFPQEVGQWYILECKEHGMQFNGDPLIGAAKHLNGASHGRLPRKHDLAVQMLGTVVLNCNQALADQNNALARKKAPGELKAGVDQDRNTRKSMPSVRPGQHEQGHKGAEYEGNGRRNEHLARMPEGPGIVNPKPGTIYAVYWKNSNAYYPVMILPWRRFRRLGWKETLSQTGLLNHVPACYLFDKKTDQEARGWAKGYEDGGPKMTKRKFPVIYFDEAEFPEGSSVGWVRANTLREFDPWDKKIRRRDIVERFLQEHPDFSDSSGSDSTSSDDEDSQASSPSRDEREGSPQEGPARQNSLPTIRSQETHGGEKAVSAPLSLISIPSDDESESEGSKEEEGEETNQSREGVERHRGRAGGVAAASTSAPPASAGGGTGGAEKEDAATAQIDPSQDVVPASTRNDNQERFDDRTAGDEDSGRNETAGKNQNKTTNERDKPSPSTTRQHEGPVTSNDIEMNHLSNAQNELAFDFDPLWRQDDLANRLSSPSQDGSQSDIQAELLRGVHRAGAGYETQGNPTTGDIASSAISLPPATYDEPPFNLNNAHVFGQQPVPDQVQVTRYEVESQPIPTPTSTTAATTLPLLRPIEDRNPWKNQPTPIPPMLTADNDQLAMIAAQAVMSHPPKELRGARLPAHETGGIAVGAPNSVSTASLFQFSPNTYMNKNAQSSVSPHPPRRGSGFFDAVLGPRTQTEEQTRVTSTQATPKATEQREVPRSQMNRSRPDVQGAPNSYGSPWLVHARLSADDGTPKGTQGSWRGGSFVS